MDSLNVFVVKEPRNQLFEYISSDKLLISYDIINELRTKSGENDVVLDFCIAYIVANLFIESSDKVSKSLKSLNDNFGHNSYVIASMFRDNITKELAILYASLSVFKSKDLKVLFREF